MPIIFLDTIQSDPFSEDALKGPFDTNQPRLGIHRVMTVKIIENEELRVYLIMISWIYIYEMYAWAPGGGGGRGHGNVPTTKSENLL